MIRKTFSQGFRHTNRWASFEDKIYTFRIKRDLSTFMEFFKKFRRFFISTEVEFQDYISDNDFDILIEIFHQNKCYALSRFNRNKDFGTFGSGIIDYKKDHIDLKCVKLAFDISRKINAQSLVMDLVIDKNEYKLLEIFNVLFQMNRLILPNDIGMKI